MKRAHKTLHAALLTAARIYFSGGDTDTSMFGSGICAAASNAARFNGDVFTGTYYDVGRLLKRMMPRNLYSGTMYLSPQPGDWDCRSWKQRAWMCLLMAQYLEDPLWR